MMYIYMYLHNVLILFFLNKILDNMIATEISTFVPHVQQPFVMKFIAFLALDQYTM